jgi:signal transduction histidine kinase
VLVEQRLQERELFLAGAEHKLKTPLMVLQGWSDVLAAEWASVPPVTRDEALRDMREAAEDAIGQLDRLLTQAHSGELSTELELLPVALSPLVHKTVRQLQAASTVTGWLPTSVSRPSCWLTRRRCGRCSGIWGRTPSSTLRTVA